MNRRMRALLSGTIVVGVIGVAVAGCEPSPEDRFVAWCKKYESSADRCACIGRKLGQDLSRDEFAKLMTAAKADTKAPAGGSAGDFLAVVAQAVGSGKAAISLTAAAMTCP